MELYGVDVSQFQGIIGWDALNAVANFVAIRVCDGTILDTQFQRNQSESRRVQASAGPLGIAWYTHTYPTLLTPQESAAYFLATIGTLLPGERLAHDLEGNLGPTPVEWSRQFATAIHDATGVWVDMYLNKSEQSGYDWTPVTSLGCKLWDADYNEGKTASPPATPGWVLAMRQWTNVDAVAGISGNVDGDTFYGAFNDFFAGGKQVPAPPPTTTTTTEAPVTTTTTTVEPLPAAPEPGTVVQPETTTTTTVAPSVDTITKPAPLPEPAAPQAHHTGLVGFLVWLFNRLRGV